MTDQIAGIGGQRRCRITAFSTVSATIDPTIDVRGHRVASAMSASVSHLPSLAYFAIWIDLDRLLRG
jgi:hypothetical protein